MPIKAISWRSLRNLHECTKLLIHSNSTDGSKSFSDASDFGHTVAGINSAQHDTDQYKFAPTSILFNGSSYLSVPDHAVFNLGGDAFTIDFWARFSSVAANRGFFQAGGIGDGPLHPVLRHIERVDLCGRWRCQCVERAGDMESVYRHLVSFGRSAKM